MYCQPISNLIIINISMNFVVLCWSQLKVRSILVWLFPVICHGVPISRQSARKQIRNLASWRGTWKVHFTSCSAWLMLHLWGQVWSMPVLYGILISSRTVMHWREFRGGLLAGSQVSTIGVQALPLCYTSFTLNLWRNVDASFDWLLCIKLWTNMWRCRWINWIWFRVIDLSEDPLLNKDLRYLIVLQLSFFAARIITEWNSLPDSITSLASVSSFRSHLSATSCP